MFTVKRVLSGDRAIISSVTLASGRVHGGGVTSFGVKLDVLATHEEGVSGTLLHNVLDATSSVQSDGADSELIAGLDHDLRFFKFDDLAHRLRRGNDVLEQIDRFTGSGLFREFTVRDEVLGRLGDRDGGLVALDVEFEVVGVTFTEELIAGALLGDIVDTISVGLNDNRKGSGETGSKRATGFEVLVEHALGGSGADGFATRVHGATRGGLGGVGDRLARGFGGHAHSNRASGSRFHDVDGELPGLLLSVGGILVHGAPSGRGGFGCGRGDCSLTGLGVVRQPFVLGSADDFPLVSRALLGDTVGDLLGGGHDEHLTANLTGRDLGDVDDRVDHA